MTNSFRHRNIIFFESIRALLQKKEEKEVSSFLYHSSTEAEAGQLNDSKTRSFYCGGHQNWLDQFAIKQPSTRHAQLRELVYCIFRQVSHRVARTLADLQYQSARVQPKGTLADHLEEFEKLWKWTTDNGMRIFQRESAKSSLNLKPGSNATSFRILKNFARLAARKKEAGFPLPIQNAAARLVSPSSM